MNLSAFSVRRPVTIAMIVLIVLLLGIVSLTGLEVDLFPEIELPVAVTIVQDEGTGPEEIEKLITKPLEQQLGTIAGLDELSSTSSQGSSMVVTMFDYGTDMDSVVTEIREKVDRVSAFFPEGAAKPLIMKADLNTMPIITLGISDSRDLSQLKKIVEDKIQPRLEKINGVASVDVSGGKTREIQIEVDPYKLQTYEISMDDIRRTIASENMDISGGYIQEGVKDFLVRGKGEFKSLEDIEELLIPLNSGGSVELKYLAEIKDTYKEVNSYSLLNGKPSIAVSITKQSDANTVNVSDKVLATIKELKEELPEGIEIKIASDQAEFIREAINQVIKNALIGAVLAVLILFLFLRNARSTIIIGTAIPISIIATFILMYFGGLTLNMVSLGGLSLGIGMMVDSAIVILENIYRYRQEGYGLKEAAVAGSSEVGTAIVSSTLTTVAVFLPIVYVQGITAQLFRPLALTVVFSLTASLLVALSLIPMLSSKYLLLDQNKNADKKGFFNKISNVWQMGLTKLDSKYQGLLGWSLRHRKFVVIGTGLVFIASLLALPLVGMEFMPEQDSGEFSVNIELPSNTLLEETSEVMEKVVQVVSELPEIDTVFVSVGSGGGMGLGSGGKSSHLASISGKLVPVSQRERGIKDVLDEIREKTQLIPGAKIEVKVSSQGGMSSSPISITLKGDELDKLEEIAAQYAEKIEQVPGTREVTTSLAEGSPEISIIIDREKASLYKVSSSQAFQTLQTGLQGAVAAKYRIDGDELDIKVVLPEENRNDIDDVKRLMVPNLQGVNVSLEEIAKIEYTSGPTSVARKDQSRIVTISGDIIGRDLGSVTKDIQSAVKDVYLPAGYSVEYGGANQDMMESFKSLGLALILAVILVYMILASQFEGLLDPFIIMFSVPVTLIGIVAGLLITGRSLSVPAFIGIIMLAGIVVNNAIVLVDYVKILRKRGMTRRDAILKAGPTRLRPILMTTLTTVLALVPQTLGIGEGSETMAPMATAVVFGLSFSTLITLVLVPVIYDLLDEGRQKRLRTKSA